MTLRFHRGIYIRRSTTPGTPKWEAPNVTAGKLTANTLADIKAAIDAEFNAPLAVQAQRMLARIKDPTP